MAPLAAVAVAALLAGCDSGGATPGSPTTEPSATGSGSPDAVPKVAQPLDPSKFLAKPCDLASKDFLTSHGYDPQGKPLTGSSAVAGPSCSWDMPGFKGGLQVIVVTANQELGTGGLKGRYDLHQRDPGGYYEPVEIGGYPAAFDDTQDLRPDGKCAISVGIADDLIFAVVGSDFFDNPQKACTEAEAMAADVLETLKGAN